MGDTEDLDRPGEGARRVRLELDREEIHRLVEVDGGRSRIFLPLEAEAHAGDRVQAEVGIRGAEQTFRLTGQVVAVRHQGRGKGMPRGWEVAVRASHRRALRCLVALADGRPIAYAYREYERHEVDWPAKLSWRKVTAEGRVTDLSLGGARVSGLEVLPSLGERVRAVLRPPALRMALMLKGRVRWLDYAAPARTCGIEFQGGGFRWKRRLLVLLEGLEPPLVR